MDRVSKKRRSKIMGAIKSENTKPELAVRSSLYKMGYGFRLHRKDLPGTPDVVLPKYGTVIFVNGCFWHQHGCDRTSMPKTNKKFWNDKFIKNKERDKNNKVQLEKMGWKVVVVWECDLNDDLKRAIKRIDGILKTRKNNTIKLGKYDGTKKQKQKKKTAKSVRTNTKRKRKSTRRSRSR